MENIYIDTILWKVTDRLYITRLQLELSQRTIIAVTMGTASSSSREEGRLIPVNEAKEKKPSQQLKNSIDDPPPKYEKNTKLPHNYEIIMKEADAVFIDIPYDSFLNKGVLLKNNTKKYWVDKESECNCFTIYPRQLSITWIEEPKYWQWCPLKETCSDKEIEVAKLKSVCWFEVHGKHTTAHLTPGVTYEVAFVVKIEDPAYGWEVPVMLRLITSTSDVQHRSEKLLDKPRGEWIELISGVFTVIPGDTRELEFSMFEYEGGEWKSGLVLQGVVIRPKK